MKKTIIFLLLITLVVAIFTILQKLSATGFSIQQDSNWKDSRNKTEFCN